MSESDTSAEPANSSKVKSNCQNPNSTTLQILFGSENFVLKKLAISHVYLKMNNPRYGDLAHVGPTLEIVGL